MPVKPVRNAPLFLQSIMGCTASDEEKKFENADSNQDGVLSKSELRKFIVEHNHGQLYQTVTVGICICKVLTLLPSRSNSI